MSTVGNLPLWSVSAFSHLWSKRKVKLFWSHGRKDWSKQLGSLKKVGNESSKFLRFFFKLDRRYLLSVLSNLLIYYIRIHRCYFIITSSSVVIWNFYFSVHTCLLLPRFVSYKFVLSLYYFAYCFTSYHYSDSYWVAAFSNINQKHQRELNILVSMNISA